MGKKKIDLSGQTFGRLTVMERYENDKNGFGRFSCKCICGKTTVVYMQSLKSGQTKSCGCLRPDTTRQRSITHGMSHSKIYNVWMKMLRRCRDINDSAYPAYGGRGIKVCERWHKFENFLEDMGIQPTNIHQLERKDNNGNYEPNNCCWATPKEQSNNRRSNRNITFNNKTQNITQWANEVGLSKITLWRRIMVSKWPIVKALTQPKMVNQYI